MENRGDGRDIQTFVVLRVRNQFFQDCIGFLSIFLNVLMGVTNIDRNILKNHADLTHHIFLLNFDGDRLFLVKKEFKYMVTPTLGTINGLFKI